MRKGFAFKNKLSYRKIFISVYFCLKQFYNVRPCISLFKSYYYCYNYPQTYIIRQTTFLNKQFVVFVFAKTTCSAGGDSSKESLKILLKIMIIKPLVINTLKSSVRHKVAEACNKPREGSGDWSSC